MELKNVNFELLETVRRKCITFAKDGNTIVKPYKTLYNVEQITGNAEHKTLYFEVVEGKETWEETTYCLFEVLGCICSKVDWIPGYWTVEEFTEKIGKWEYFGKAGLLKRLKYAEENGWYINLLDIELCVILEELELAKHYAEYRESRKKAMAEAEERKRAEREAKEREEEEKRLAEVKKTITEAENIIRTQGTLYNDEFEGKTIVLHLLKKYGVNVPLKTQGWINNALAKVWFKDGEITYSYYTTSRNSTVFMKYLKKLEYAILKEYGDITEEKEKEIIKEEEEEKTREELYKSIKPISFNRMSTRDEFDLHMYIRERQQVELNEDEIDEIYKRLYKASGIKDYDAIIQKIGLDSIIRKGQNNSKLSVKRYCNKKEITCTCMCLKNKNNNMTLIFTKDTGKEKYSCIENIA